METLISMTSFVKKVLNEDRPCDRGAILDEIGNYAEFLSQPLTLRMFVPCDENGNVLTDTSPLDYQREVFKGEFQFKSDLHLERYINLEKEYSKAKSRVLFEGFEYKKAEFCDEPMLEVFIPKTDIAFIYDCEDKNFEVEEDIWGEDVESLIKYNLQLTETAKQKIGL